MVVGAKKRAINVETLRKQVRGQSGLPISQFLNRDTVHQSTRTPSKDLQKTTGSTKTKK